MILNQELFKRKSFAYFCGYQAIFFVNSTMSFSHFPTQSFSKLDHYLNNEYADMVYCYGLPEGNINIASQMYREKYPNWRHPSQKVIQGMFSHLKELGCFYMTALKQPLRRSIEDKKRILEIIQENVHECMRNRSRDQYFSYNGMANHKFKWNVSVPFDSCCYDVTRRFGTSTEFLSMDCRSVTRPFT